MPATREGLRRPELPTSVTIREVGPRDGLQAESPIPSERRVELVRALAEAGCRAIEVASFVSERAVPAMAGAAEVVAGVAAALGRAHLRDGVTLTALVPNRRGAERALSTGIDALTVTVSASAAYNEKNVRMTIDESVAEIAEVTHLAAAEPVPVDAVVSCCFGSPFGEQIRPGDVAALAVRLAQVGCSALTLADTTGVASPLSVNEVLAAVGDAGGGGTGEIGLHLHDTRGTALLNAWVAMELGVNRFDTAVGGLGGSPFAPGAGGNLATEDLVALLDDVGIATGIELAGVLRAGNLVEELVGHTVPSRTMSALRGSVGAY